MNTDKIYIKPCNSTCSFCFMNYVDVLNNNFLFKGLTPKEVGQIIKKVHHQVKTFQKGDLLLSSGDVYDSLYLIVEGSVVAEMIDLEGNSIRIEELEAPDIIASAFIFGSENTLPVDVICTQDARTLIIQKSNLLEIFMDNRKVLQNYLDISADRAQLLSRRIKLLGLNSIKGKIAHFLLEQVKAQGKTSIVLKQTQEELANRFGVSRPSLSRVMRELHKDKIICASGKQISILDKKSLSMFLR